jgi:hypothetical protein
MEFGGRKKRLSAQEALGRIICPHASPIATLERLSDRGLRELGSFGEAQNAQRLDYPQSFSRAAATPRWGRSL